MKVKTRTDRRTGQMSAEYYAIADKTRFRVRLLQKILEAAQEEMVLMVDTNQRLTDASDDELLDTLKRTGLEPLVLPIAANSRHFFGFNYSPKKKRALEKLILISFDGGTVPGEEALSTLAAYDIALGVGPDKTLQELGNLMSIGTPLYGSGLFRQEMYDSILCATVRSSFDISRHIKEATDEMGL